jgi:hypothetical protein
LIRRVNFSLRVCQEMHFSIECNLSTLEQPVPIVRL